MNEKKMNKAGGKNLLNNFYDIHNKRAAWLLLAITGFVFLGIALYFQHVLDMQPCFLCINQRVAMFFIAVAGLIGFINPKNKIFLYTGYAFWSLASLFGLSVATYQTYIQMNPPEFGSCGAGMDFILENNSLFEAIPILLQPTGDCFDVNWYFLGLTMPQWMVFVFSVSLLTSLFFMFGKKIIKK